MPKPVVASRPGWRGRPDYAPEGVLVKPDCVFTCTARLSRRTGKGQSHEAFCWESRLGDRGQQRLGAAIAGKLVSGGARVFGVQLEDTGHIEAIVADLCDPGVPDMVIDYVVQQAGRLDILVNNAGRMVEAKVDETGLDEWQRTMALNLDAPFLLIRRAIPHLRRSRGSIVNIGSIEGLASNPGHAAYCASKAGLHGLTRAVAVDGGQDGVRCNGVAPGWIVPSLTPIFVAALPEQARGRLGTIHPLGRTGRVEEVAAMVAWIASDEAAFSHWPDLCRGWWPHCKTKSSMKEVVVRIGAGRVEPIFWPDDEQRPVFEDNPICGCAHSC
ncbi:SDR family oxidoreductase [Mesorhizobium sp. AA23]|nr:MULTISPECIES: SDR family oxidoreductase [Mesorhizobium]